MLAVFQILQGDGPDGIFEIECVPCSLQYRIRSHVGQDQEFESASGNGVS